MIGEVRPTRETMPVPRTLGGDMEQNELRRPARARTGQSTSDLLACCWIRIRRLMELPRSQLGNGPVRFKKRAGVDKKGRRTFAPPISETGCGRIDRTRSIPTAPDACTGICSSLSLCIHVSCARQLPPTRRINKGRRKRGEPDLEETAFCTDDERDEAARRLIAANKKIHQRWDR
jgi:hypothetical protein